MDVRLPKLGEGADSGVVVSILVQEGDTIEEGQTILELENEKAVAPIPAPAPGKVQKIRVKTGDKISVGQVILSIADEAGARPTEGSHRTDPASKPTRDAAPAAIEKAEKSDGDDTTPVRSEADVIASPSIRKLAHELDIDLARVPGSDPGGRITMVDLRAYVQRLQKLATQPKTPVPAPAAPRPAAEIIDFSRWGPITRKPASPLRKVISQRMKESWTNVPRITQFDEADITALMELRKKWQAAYDAQGARLTLTPLVLKAAVAMLKKHPIFNTSLDETAGEIVFKAYYHIGLAVDTDAGLLVPVVRDVDKKNLLQLATEVEDLAARARERKLSLEEMKGGTFTISNQGGIGGGHFTPIVNLPEVAILGLGRATLKAIVRDGKIESRLMLPIAVSYDHRVIDGGIAARFTVDLVKTLEEFSESELKL